jgi:hypothetical protein
MYEYFNNGVQRIAVIRTFALSDTGVHLQNEFTVFIIQIEIPLISDSIPKEASTCPLDIIVGKGIRGISSPQ